jgi:hypothetical protein
MAIIEAAVEPERRLTAPEFLAATRKPGLKSPSEAAAMVRADRDSGHRDQ